MDELIDLWMHTFTLIEPCPPSQESSLLTMGDAFEMLMKMIASSHNQGCIIMSRPMIR